MSELAGPCEWCGGPQQWTVHAGEVLERCVNGCIPIWEVVVLPPGSEDGDEEWYEGGAMEHSEREGVVSCEGGAAEEIDRSVLDDGLPF